MVKPLRRWLEANELFAIVTGVVGALLLLSMLLGARRLSDRHALKPRVFFRPGAYRFQLQMPPDLHGQA